MYKALGRRLGKADHWNARRLLEAFRTLCIDESDHTFVGNHRQIAYQFTRRGIPWAPWQSGQSAPRLSSQDDVAEGRSFPPSIGRRSAIGFVPLPTEGEDRICRFPQRRMGIRGRRGDGGVMLMLTFSLSMSILEHVRFRNLKTH
jgi:hypothetical protein